MLCDDLEESSEMLSSNRKLLEQSATKLRIIAQEIDKVHKEVTDDVIFKSGIAVGVDLIRIGVVALDVMLGAPIISTVGLGISLLGEYLKGSAHSKEQTSNSYYMGLAEEIFKDCEQSLQEASDTYRRIEQRFQRLEKEERLSGTILHKKLLEIKISFPHIQAWREAMLRSHNDRPGGNYKYVSEIGNRALHVLAGYMGASSKILHSAEALYGIYSLYHDGSEMYKEIKHRNEGARSELAENLRAVANYFDGVSQRLHQVLNKEWSVKLLV